MTFPSRALAPLLLLGALALVADAGAQGGPSSSGSASPGAASPPDESVLGTVEVDGSGGRVLPPLPKLAIVPLPSVSVPDNLLNMVVRRDLELSGQFNVLDMKMSPPGPFSRTLTPDLAAFGAIGAEYIVRAYAETEGAKTKLVMEAFLAPKAGAPEPSAPVAPAYRTALVGDTDHLRPTVHKLVDALLGALTGRIGGFSSNLAYAARVGDWRTAYVLDADGFDLHSESPKGVTILSPTFGPGGHLFYAMSANYAPFRVAATEKGLTFPFTLPGSVLGLAFSSDQTKAALTVMSEGTSSLWLAEKGVLKQTPAAPFANHPTFGPLGKLAYAGGSPVQRVYVDGKPISPAGFMASSPVFCDTPEGLLVLFTVQVSGGADIIAMDSKGGSIRRLTQRQGSNSFPACSPDGRLIAFFSSTKTGAGSGLYLMPVARPWLAKKVSNELGESLQWDRRHLEEPQATSTAAPAPAPASTSTAAPASPVR